MKGQIRGGKIKHTDLEQIISHILIKRVPDQPLFIAVDGMTCSGKTTFAKNLADALTCGGLHTCNITTDDFCNPRALRYRSDEPDALQVYKYNFMEDFFVEKVLRPAKVNMDLEFTFTALDPVTDLYSKQVSYTMHKQSIVIVEGVFILKPIFNSYFDYRIMITVDPKIQLTRAMVRDVVDRDNPLEKIEEKYLKRYRPSFEYYLQNDQPMNRIDLHIINDDPDFPKLEFR